jgi:hypothetical protein
MQFIPQIAGILIASDEVALGAVVAAATEAWNVVACDDRNDGKQVWCDPNRLSPAEQYRNVCGDLRLRQLTTLRINQHTSHDCFRFKNIIM